MLGSHARAAMLGLALWAAAGAARADELSDFNAAVEAAEAHNRVAIGYLRTGNGDLASLEIDRLREAWGKVGAVKRPAVFDSTLYVGMLTDASMRLVTADMLLNSGRLDNARQSLEALRADLYNLRKSAGIVPMKTSSSCKALLPPSGICRIVGAPHRSRTSSATVKWKCRSAVWPLSAPDLSS